MRVGLGTGTTVAPLLDAVAARGVFENLDGLYLAIDGADQIAPDGWLVKGRGRALSSSHPIG